MGTRVGIFWREGWSVPFTFFARDAFEFAHIRSGKGCADHGEIVYLRGLLTALIILEEELDALHVLVLDKLERNRSAI